MQWNYVPGDPASITIDGDLDRIVITDLAGMDNVLAYIGQIASFYAERNIRAGYDLKLEGSCNKGPQGINWGPFEIVFEDDPGSLLLRNHLEALWGPQNTRIETLQSDEAMASAVHWL